MAGDDRLVDWKVPKGAGDRDTWCSALSKSIGPPRTLSYPHDVMLEYLVWGANVLMERNLKGLRNRRYYQRRIDRKNSISQNEILVQA